MENQLFRKKSMERISSPEQLQDYMRVTNPGIWMVLAAVIALLVGMIICASTGTVETKVSVECDAEQGALTVALPPEEGEHIEAGMTLRVAGRDIPIDYVYQSDEDKFIVSAHADLDDGVYDAEIITESLSPISFLIDN